MEKIPFRNKRHIIFEDDQPNFRQLRSKMNKRRIYAYLLVIIIIVCLVIFLWLWPSWFADISLNAQLYANKANADYISIHFLNFWSTNFFFNKTNLISGIIGAIILVIPPDRTLLLYITKRLGRKELSLVKSIAIYGGIGFIIFYLFGFFINADGTFAYTAYLIETGELGFSANIILNAFNVIFNINNQDFITIFLYSNIVNPIISLVLGLVIFRLVLYIIRGVYLRRNDFHILTGIFSIIGVGFLIAFFALPLQALDGINLIQIWSVILGSISFIVLGILISVIGKSKSKTNARDIIIPQELRKKVIIVIVSSVILVIIPLLISLGPIINLNNTAVWTEQLWKSKIARQIQWSRECAGLDMFEERPIENFTQSTTVPDSLMVSQIRQCDQDFAVQNLAASIGTTYEGLADSDIVYINNKEYWVAPKTVRFSQIEGDAVQTNTELYDHVEGFLAMDTFSGHLVNVTTTFNISESYPIFFGESESQRFLELKGFYSEGIGAYDSDILLGTEWAKGIPNNKYVYEGSPDGTLGGLEGFWKTVNIGLLAYSINDTHSYLINRNVKTRVRDILYPQLTIDNDPYLVFNTGTGKLYYAVSMYTKIKVGSYANVPILRFMGVCLVDVLNGEMKFYENPKIDINDPTYPLWKLYLTKYDWEPTPSWLLAQLRYPEDLFEQQLEANYIYHVQNPSTWKRADSFQERPPNGDLFYIETDVGDGIEYVGLDLVEYKGEGAHLLAGIYIVRHGTNFGKALFYYTSASQNFIGPKIARDAYNSTATQQISLIAGARNGNTLIYPLAGSIYYYIPTYSTTGTIQELKLAGFVEAFNLDVGYGANAQDAYNALNITEPTPTTNLSISYDFSMDSQINYPSDPAAFSIHLQNLNNTFSTVPTNVKVNLTLFTNTEHNVNYTFYLPPNLLPLENSSFIDGIYTGYNYTIVNRDFYFGEGLTLNGYFNVDLSNIILYYKWTLIVDGKVVYESQEELIQVLQ